MKKLFALVATLTLTVGLMLVAVSQALACVPAKFSLEVTPRTVEEGGRVRITVKADNPSDGSTIDIETVDESAKTGQDYTGIPKQSLHFGMIGSSQNQKSYEFTVPVANDSTTEAAETFKVRLSNPRTCTGGGPEQPDGVVAPEPVRVTIAANNTVSNPPATSPALKTSPVPSSSRQSLSPASNTSPVHSPSPQSHLPDAQSAQQTGQSPEGAPEAAGSESPSALIRAQRKSGDGNKAAIVVTIALLTAAGAGFGLWKLRRS